MTRLFNEPARGNDSSRKVLADDQARAISVHDFDLEFSEQSGASPSSAASSTRHIRRRLELKGEVCLFPWHSALPLPTNGSASYGHCEAALYLHIREGHYGSVTLDNLKLINIGGQCDMSYQSARGALFRPPHSNRTASCVMKLMGSFCGNRPLSH